MTWVALTLAGALGAVARFAISSTLEARWGGPIPGGTLVVNITGAFALGVTAGGEGPMAMGVFGFLGGFTTFSTWMVETLLLATSGAGRRATLNIGAMAVLGVGAAALGVALGP